MICFKIYFRLKDLDEHDRARLAKAKAKNSLESFIVDTRDKLYTNEYEKASTEEEMANIQKALSEMSDWLEYESDDATTEVINESLIIRESMCISVFLVWQTALQKPEK